MAYADNEDFFHLVQGVLECARPLELELGCWGFVRNVNKLVDTLLPHGQTLHTLRIHFMVVDGASNRRAIVSFFRPP